MATFNSRSRPPARHKLAAAGLLLLGGLLLAHGGDQKKVFALRAETAFHEAQIQFLSDTNNATNAWNFARTSFDLCAFATNETQHADLASQGIAACQQLIAREPKSAPAHYYLAMNYGELADAEAPSIAAYKLIKEIEREFKVAQELDEKFDFAGPARNLGELYFQAPGWPLSIGSKRKAREWLERAAKIAPQYPENILNLAEGYWHWQEHAAASLELNALDALWSNAQTNFTGTAWEESWGDWTARREVLRKELSEITPSAKPSR